MDASLKNSLFNSVGWDGFHKLATDIHAWTGLDLAFTINVVLWVTRFKE